MSKLARLTAISGLSVAVLGLSGCAAMSTYMNHKDLSVNSKMSESIFLDPQTDKDKTIYVNVKSTLSQDFSGLEDKLDKQLEDRGWTIVDNTKQANDMVQVNVLQAGKVKSVKDAYDALNSGYGGDIATGVFTGLSTGVATDSGRTAAGVGLAASAASWAANQMVEDVTYSMITDIQVSQRQDGEVTQHTSSSMNQGSSTNVSQSYDQKSNWLKYRTRIVSTADKVNLDFKEAVPHLENQIAKEVAGIFG